MILQFLSSVALLLALVGAADAQQKLTGIAAWSALVGNTVTGRIEGKDYTDYYLADGTVKALEDSRVTTGKWTLEGLNVCFWHRGPKECYTVEVVDNVATFTGQGGSGYRVNILKGNAKNL